MKNLTKAVLVILGSSAVLMGYTIGMIYLSRKLQLSGGEGAAFFMTALVIWLAIAITGVGVSQEFIEKC
jgi:hypothetical protein